MIEFHQDVYLFGSDATGWVVDQHLFEHVEGIAAGSSEERLEWCSRELLELVVIGEMGHSLCRRIKVRIRSCGVK